MIYYGLVSLLLTLALFFSLLFNALLSNKWGWDVYRWAYQVICKYWMTMLRYTIIFDDSYTSWIIIKWLYFYAYFPPSPFLSSYPSSQYKLLLYVSNDQHKAVANVDASFTLTVSLITRNVTIIIMIHSSLGTGWQLCYILR